MTQTGSTADALTGDLAQATPTRRSLRAAETAAAAAAKSGAFRRSAPAAPARRATAARTAATTAVARTAATTAAPTTTATRRTPVKRRVLPVVVVTLTAGLLSTQVLPALAAQQSVGQSDGSSQAAVDAANLRTTDSQSVRVSSAAALADTARDGYTASDPAVLAAANTAKAAETARIAAVQTARAQTAASFASYTGPTAADYVANPKYPSFSLDQVAAVGQQYIGTPYVFGGATPAGFDCSGFVMYVYAQFGISLAHSVPLQDAAGTRISEADAQPGDVVIFNNEAHDGFYMGNGMIMDAPKPGGRVSIRPIWTSDYHIVRFGIK
ncbi:C40 family peptidase [Curtobacterium sp. RRHDQ10]|uniref:C40 family peptidase n=1 Tax=Curtobacterium phyllosphaerae TaxID=3413379 RepID=UPI003BF4380E